MPSVYKLRTYCPTCGVLLRPDNLRAHLRKRHPDIHESRVNKLEDFIARAIAANPTERIALDLNNLSITFLDRPRQPTVERKQFRIHRVFVQSTVVPTRTVSQSKIEKIESNTVSASHQLSRKDNEQNRKSGLLAQLECPFCHGFNGLESSHGCFYCG